MGRQFDRQDAFDFDMDGVPDDFNGDNAPDNRFYFDHRSRYVPDADSFDDYQVINPDTGAVEIPRGRIAGARRLYCGRHPHRAARPHGADGRPFQDWEPSSYCLRPEAEREQEERAPPWAPPVAAVCCPIAATVLALRIRLGAMLEAVAAVDAPKN